MKLLLYNKFLYHLQKFIERVSYIGEDSSCILMFHKVEKADKNIELDEYSISVNNFEEICKSHQDKAVSIYDIAQIQKANVIFSFDDVYQNIYTNAYPILKKYNIPFVLFVTINNLDKEFYLSTEQLLEMSTDPLCVIGTHCMDHVSSRILTKEEITWQLYMSKEILSKMIDKEIKSFAFPYGSLNAVSIRDIRLCKKIGYKICCTTLKMPISYHTVKKAKKGKFILLPRINMNDEYAILKNGR